MQAKQGAQRKIRTSKQPIEISSKQPIEISSSKPSTSTELTQKIILLEWNLVGEQFLNNATFHKHQNNLRLHIFFNKQDKDNVKIQHLKHSLGSYVTLHESLTESNEAAWIDLLAFLINFYTKTMTSCHHCAIVHPRPHYHVTLVTNQTERYTELKALLKSNRTETTIIDGHHSTILDIFDHVCHDCRLIFAEKYGAEQHDKQHHNFLCSNTSCERSKRGNGFFRSKEVLEHEAKQKQCEFCLDIVYCDLDKYKEHMEKNHISCTCSCGKFYCGKEDFMEHVCGNYPLPCLEDPDCEARFHNLDEQAFHHKTVHGSVHPYFCLACYGQAKLVCVRTSEELMTHVSEANHKEKDFQVVIVPEEEKDG